MIGGDTFSALAPVLDPLTQKLAMSPSSTVHGGQHGTKYAAVELLLRAAFVADENWGFTLEPARRAYGRYLTNNIAHVGEIVIEIICR